MKKHLGITLLELMLALAAGAVLLSLGVPSFVNTIRNSEMTSATNALVGALHAGRSEAVKRRARVSVCRSDNSGADPVCSNTGDGLAVFVNTANDTSIDPGSGDIIIRATSWLPETIEVTTADIPNAVTFTTAGFTRDTNGAAITGDLLFCGPMGDKGARVLSISPTGRPLVRHHGDVSGASSCPS